MPIIRPLRKDILEYIKAHGLNKKWQKSLLLFETNPRHPSLVGVSGTDTPTSDEQFACLPDRQAAEFCPA